MKYGDLQKCVHIAEEHCSLCGMRIADTDVSLVSFQNGANGKVQQKLCFAFDFADAKISLEIIPKGD